MTLNRAYQILSRYGWLLMEANSFPSRIRIDGHELIYPINVLSYWDEKMLAVFPEHNSKDLTAALRTLEK